MAISQSSVWKCLEGDGCHIWTLLYLIIQNDVENDLVWDTDLITKIVIKAVEDFSTGGDAQQCAIDLHSALERIHLANHFREMREAERRSEELARTANK